MANCCICGRKLGGWGEDKLTIASEKDCCYQCAPLIRAVENAEDSKLFYAKLNELNKKMDDSSTNHEVRETVENKFREMSINKGYTKEDGLSCPVCGMPLKADEISCPRCGVENINREDDPDYTKLAEIYSNRFSQLVQNPMYEYRVETVSDSAVLGTFDKDAVQTTLRKYAIKG